MSDRVKTFHCPHCGSEHTSFDALRDHGREQHGVELTRSFGVPGEHDPARDQERAS